MRTKLNVDTIGGMRRSETLMETFATTNGCCVFLSLV